MEELWDDYLLFLIWRCNLQEKEINGLELVLEVLHNTEFTYVLNRDGNRFDDGMELRNDYEIPCSCRKYIDEFMNRPCSVLEMLMALAIRVDNEIIGDPAEEHPERFFMEMIENLGLLRYRNYKFKMNEVTKIIQLWMHRRFHKDGVGSPFPVKYSRIDQRDFEIWDQMNTYISENYG